MNWRGRIKLLLPLELELFSFHRNILTPILGTCRTMTLLLLRIINFLEQDIAPSRNDFASFYYYYYYYYYKRKN